ncbi:LirA/MavJ family T4SS effector [Legionella genomosp. 1]|uniref:LirA/MavJ family T4SS effector n=1 Tax=Legionella genomosp. 1 TaxID=1093625 RepID=UPI0010569969|nr:LirA/MavJ family T4SS effector [Legionella genomosp. 1]
MLQLITKGNSDNNDYKLYLSDTGFSSLEESLEQDVIKVLSFLCNEEMMLAGFKKFAKSYYEFKQSEGRAGRTEKHTIRKFFDEWGSVNHFNQGSDEPVPAEYRTNTEFDFPKSTAVLIDELTTGLFLDVLLKNAYLSSDPGAGVTHGKWSHSIQLFILEEARKSGFLQLNAVNIAEFIKQISQIKPEFGSLNLWYLIFDSTLEGTFTCPDMIVRTLESKLDEAEESIYLSEKMNVYKKKSEIPSSEVIDEKRYNTYVAKKYARRTPELGFIEADQSRGLLWFTHKKTTGHEQEISPSMNIEIK